MCGEGASRDANTWGLWDDGIKEKIYFPSTARDMQLRYYYETRRLGMFMLFVVIWMGTSTRYIISRRLLLSKWYSRTSRTYKNRGETVTKRFFYPEPMDIIFCYLHHIYDHNQCRHQLIGLENVWRKCFWENRVFAFLFSVTYIKTYKIHHRFKECPERSILDFRFELDFQMILNELPGSISNIYKFK